MYRNIKYIFMSKIYIMCKLGLPILIKTDGGHSKWWMTCLNA